MAESALLESGNIVGSAFVSAVAALVQEKLLLSVPSLARGSAKSCIEALVSHAGSVALATRFSCPASGQAPGAGGAHPGHAGSDRDRGAGGASAE